MRNIKRFKDGGIESLTHRSPAGEKPYWPLPQITPGRNTSRNQIVS